MTDNAGDTIRLFINFSEAGPAREKQLKKVLEVKGKWGAADRRQMGGVSPDSAGPCWPRAIRIPLGGASHENRDGMSERNSARPWVPAPHASVGGGPPELHPAQ